MRNRMFIILLIAGLLFVGCAFAESSRDFFCKLSLPEAINLALSNNPRISKGKQRIFIAKSETKIKQAEFLPKLSLKSNYGEWGVDKPRQSSESYEAGVTLTQPIYKGGGIRADFKKSQVELQKSESQLEEEGHQIIFEVTKTYYNILKARETVKFNEDMLEQAKKNLAFVVAKFKTGSLLRLNVLLSDLNMLDAEQKLIDSRNELQLAETTFNNLLGLGSETSFELSDKLVYSKMTEELETVLKQAYGIHPKLHEVQLDIVAAEMEVEKAQSDYFRPELDIVGEYKRLGDTADYNYNELWSANLVVKLPIFEGGANRAEIEKAKFQLEEVKSEEQVVRKEIELNIRKAYLQLKKLEELIPLKMETVEKAEENFYITQKIYELGEVKNKEVLDAQSLLGKSKMEYLDMLYDYSIVNAELDRARGFWMRYSKQ